VVRVYAPASLLRAGVIRTWTILFALGLALLVMGLLFADRLGRRLVGAVTGLAGTADRLASGDLAARATLTGPRELRGVGAELNRLAARIGELLTAEREEVADLAHRLRTPVTALRLDADGIGDPDDRDRLAADVDQLTRVVDEVIRTARRPVREGAGARVDLAGLVAQRVAFWTPLAQDDGRRIDLTVPPAPVYVRCATADLAAAFDALIENVFAHTPDGVGMRVIVTAHASGGGDLAVQDDGPGFSLEDTARGAGDGRSTGLGLDIARRTAESAGGSMNVKLSLTGGSIVTLTFASFEVEDVTQV
jgi:signal transduction histidine kinase